MPEICIFCFRLSIKLKQSNSRSKQRGFICVPQVNLSKAYCRFLKPCLGWPKMSYELTPIRKENSVFFGVFLTTLRHNWVTIPVTVTQNWQCPILWRITCVKQTYLPADLHCWLEHESLPLFDFLCSSLWLDKADSCRKIWNPEQMVCLGFHICIFIFSYLHICSLKKDLCPFF